MELGGPGLSGAAPELPAIAANASGDSVVVWEEGGSDKTVKAAYRPAGGVFTAPDSIGVSNQLGTSPPSRPVVAIDPEGNVLALWRRIADGVHSRVQAAFRPAGGAWSAVQELTPADAFGGNPDVVADEHGGFLVGWLLGTVSAVVQVSRATSGGGFGPVDTISNTGAGTPDLAVNGDGDAVATWIRTEGTLSFVEARTAAAGQPFRDPQVLSPTDSNADQPVAAVAPDGRAT